MKVVITRDAAYLLCMSPNTLKKWITAGKLVPLAYWQGSRRSPLFDPAYIAQMVPVPKSRITNVKDEWLCVSSQDFSPASSSPAGS